MDQDLSLGQPQAGSQELPMLDELQHPVLQNYLPADSIQGRNDAEGHLVEPFEFRFNAYVPPRADLSAVPGQGETQRIHVSLDVFLVTPHCLFPEKFLYTRSMMQDFIVRSNAYDTRGEVIEKAIVFFMIEHPTEGIHGTGLLNNFATLEEIRIRMLPEYVPILPIKNPTDFYQELIGYLHRASQIGELHPPRPDLATSPPDSTEQGNRGESSDVDVINEDDSFRNNFYAAIEFLDRSLDDPGGLAVAQQIMGRSTANRLGQLIHTVAPII
ncbi:hypothetical protein N7533_001627 [Penicillium manginii]|uniref:uncharacterized protein n=1 Tax=Penicillium manginii TaxID=203109 RepID=UPI002546B40F|nr:uncharacterized protein N7533_001627 [Penicillium manginii]KAJ5762946.1 hypothetical protein N7533_001627 [Penicillium manginii]